MRTNPWELRTDALQRALTPHEFGRLLVHLNQRRGAFGILTESDEAEAAENAEEEDGKSKEEGAVKAGIDKLEKVRRQDEHFGQTMARLYVERQTPATNRKNQPFAIHGSIRNRRDSHEFHATRKMILDEFEAIWQKQVSIGGVLAELLTDEFRTQFDNPKPDATFRHKGIVFEQRKSYWRTGTMGRCDLEPTDQCCPMADMHAQEFRVLENVNNIRIRKHDEEMRALSDSEREKVIAALRNQKKATGKTIRTALGINRREVAAFYELNTDSDAEREINTDWFYREIVLGAIGEDTWFTFDESRKESVNRALQKFDPDVKLDRERLAGGCRAWWGLSEESTGKLNDAWKKRPKLENRVSLSRHAILNLLPYMRLGASVTEAREAFSKDAASSATPEQRARYAFTVDADLIELLNELVGEQKAEALLRLRGANKAKRRFMEKHADVLPPAPMLANPVVRKAIHEVRRHLNEYLRRFGRKPDRVVIEMAREAKQSGKVRNEILARNRQREKIRKKIAEDYQLENLNENQRRRGEDRVLLWRQQKGLCPYCDSPQQMSDTDAARGHGVEVDHVIPKSRGGEDGLNNRVLCHRDCNRNKGNETAKEWIARKGLVDTFKQRFAHLAKPTKSDTSYFRRSDFKRKRDNLDRDVKEADVAAWRESQLSDTSYAAREVSAYLQEALFHDAPRNRRQILFTKGRYTAILRADWQLYHEVAAPSEDGAKPASKTRANHYHHAIDAVVIALSGPAIVKELADIASRQEETYKRTGERQKRDTLPVPKPWTSLETFRAQVMGHVFGDNETRGLVICHRPVKRRLVGALHEETLYGTVDMEAKVFVTRLPLVKLTPKMLRMPVPIENDNGCTVLMDPPLGKGGLVRDLEMRRILREIMQANHLSADEFSPKDVQRLLESGAFRMPSGVPITAVKVLRTIKNPVVIQSRGKPRRVYIGGNNHHVEILRNRSNGRWSGRCVSMYEAIQRLKGVDESANTLLIQKNHGDKLQFVMSLAEGEMIHARPKQGSETGYFVVKKLELDGKSISIVLAPDWDARSAADQERWSVSPADLANCGPTASEGPYKVRVSPLGAVIRVEHD
ncbi:MAG: hypothetical protein AMXMBFR84_35930 [Candidatus Hydrogenedentota bacterium]